jgi:uncharacterized BrkB/YihY/UPF0761 family membrane protein
MKYNKQKAIKYFIEQKVKEIGLFLLIVAAIIFIPYLLGQFVPSDFACGEVADCAEGSLIDWLNGLSLLLIIIIIGLVLLFVFALFYRFIKSNWEKAKKRARE